MNDDLKKQLATASAAVRHSIAYVKKQGDRVVACEKDDADAIPYTFIKPSITEYGLMHDRAVLAERQAYGGAIAKKVKVNDVEGELEGASMLGRHELHMQCMRLVTKDDGSRMFTETEIADFRIREKQGLDNGFVDAIGSQIVDASNEVELEGKAESQDAEAGSTPDASTTPATD